MTEMNLRKGLVGHWTMDNQDTSGGVLYDKSGYDNHGIVNNSPTKGVDSTIGQAYSFENDNNEWVDIDNGINNILDGSEEASLTCWIKLPTNDPSDSEQTGPFSFCGSSASNNHYSWTNTDIYFNVFRQNRIDNIDDNGFDKTNWHLLAITTTPGSNGWKLYQNKNLVTSVNGESSVTTTVDAAIGRNVTGGHDFTGKISDFRLYNRKLSENEINQLYQMREQQSYNVQIINQQTDNTTMTIELEDVQTFSGEIANGASETLEVKTATEHTLQVLINDGANDVAPLHDLLVEYYVPALDEWMTYTTRTSSDAPSFEVDVRAARTRVTVTNDSGESTNYTIAVQTFRDF